MDADAKKIALRMIPYGIYVLAGRGPDGTIAAATVNWVTQTAFAPPLVVVGVKADSQSYRAIQSAGVFALNMLGKGQEGLAFDFFKPTQLEGGKLNGEPFHAGTTGAPILDNAPACIECKVVEVVARGDHHIVIGEVVEAHVAKAPPGRPDDATLEMRELGPKVFYGG
ncbi:MAG: flavin reductase family protein [Alphaproteobacteria bacterium]|nr:flavin reductase family protein [Alphaproteobacteria bacterium]